MAIRAVAGQTQFALNNKNNSRINANPPVVFPDFNLAQDFTWCVWVKALDAATSFLSVHASVDGDQINFGHNATKWILSTRYGSVSQPTVEFADLIVGRWNVICLVKKANVLNVYHGLEEPEGANPQDHPVTITLKSTTPIRSLASSALDNFIVYAQTNQSIANLKFWNVALTLPILQVQVQRWDDNAGGTGGATPFWASPLRVPGDMSNIANPYAAVEWDDGHAFSYIVPPDNVIIDRDDPAYLAKNQQCPSWIYPNVVFPAIADSFVDPGNAPISTTTYKATQFFRFQDRGTITLLDTQITSILFFGLPINGPDPGVPVDFVHGLYKDENLVELGTVIPSNLITTGYTPVDLTASLRSTTMFAWQFGAQFTWNAHTPSTDLTVTAHLAYMLLYVRYIGIPPGIPRLSPPEDFAGLFIINKGSFIDHYNNFSDLQIPHPTIRTAYIGE